MLRLTNINLSYFGMPALKIEEFSADGSFAVVGCSGSGKSNFIKVIAGLEQIDSGYIYIGEEEVGEQSPAERHISLISSRTPLKAGKSAYQNLIYPLKKRRIGKFEIAAAIDSVAHILCNDANSINTNYSACDTRKLLSKKVKNLSGEERTRLILARALIKNPRLILLDEPSEIIEDMEVFSRLLKSLSIVFIIATYDYTLAAKFVEQFVILRGGSIIFSGDSAGLKACENPYVQKMCL